MSGSKPQEIEITSDMPVIEFLVSVVTALHRNGEEAATMPVDCRINGLVGRVYVTVSIEDHPVNIEANRVAHGLLANLDRDGA